VLQVYLLQEPVAAAMAYGFGKPTDAETLLVFDLGGGTYDVSVVESFEGIMEVGGFYQG
jgi:molecular chaperone DnaK (HSP70)